MTRIRNERMFVVGFGALLIFSLASCTADDKKRVFDESVKCRELAERYSPEIDYTATPIHVQTIEKVIYSSKRNTCLVRISGYFMKDSGPYDSHLGVEDLLSMQTLAFSGTFLNRSVHWYQGDSGARIDSSADMTKDKIESLMTE